MKTEQTIHVMPMDGQWTVMTDDKSYIKEGFDSKAEAIRCAGQVAAEGKFTFLMIHSEKQPKKPVRSH